MAALCLAAPAALADNAARSYECRAIGPVDHATLILEVPDVPDARRDEPTPTRVTLRGRDIEALYQASGLDETWAVELGAGAGVVELRPNLLAEYRDDEGRETRFWCAPAD